MIKNFIFDMGNVLIRFEPEIFAERYGFSAEDTQFVFDKIFRSGMWAKTDEGIMTEAELWEEVKDGIPDRLKDGVEMMLKRWDEPLIIVDGTEKLIAELKGRGYKIYLLSNASSRQHEYWGRIPASRYFDGTVISADEKCVKPDVKIFEILLERFGLEAGECFFIDDSSANCAGAEKAGIKSFVFRNNIDDLRAEIENILLTTNGN